MCKNVKEILGKLDYEILEKVVDTDLKAAYISAVGSNLSGWHSDLLLHDDGTISLTDVMSYGSMTMSQYEGSALTLYSLPSYIEPTCNVVLDTDLKELSESDYQKLYAHVLDMYDIETDLEEVGENTLESLINFKNLDLDTLFMDVFPELYSKLEVEAIVCDWDNYYRDRVLSEIDYTTDELINHYEYELNFNR